MSDVSQEQESEPVEWEDLAVRQEALELAVEHAANHATGDIVKLAQSFYDFLTGAES